jgi:hypothetical protein
MWGGTKVGQVQFERRLAAIPKKNAGMALGVLRASNVDTSQVVCGRLGLPSPIATASHAPMSVSPFLLKLFGKLKDCKRRLGAALCIKRANKIADFQTYVNHNGAWNTRYSD